MKARDSPSGTTENVGESPLRHGSSTSLLSYKEQAARKVIFDCTVEEESSKEDQDKESSKSSLESSPQAKHKTCVNELSESCSKQQQQMATTSARNGIDDLLDTSSSSDDSYVKIFTTNNTSSDLSGFFQDV